MSTELTMPSIRLMATRNQASSAEVIRPENIMAASVPAWRMDSDWVRSSSRRRSQRSAKTPATGAKSRLGICPAKLTMPSIIIESVSRKTSHCMAMCCIQVPISDRPWPKKKRR